MDDKELTEYIYNLSIREHKKLISGLIEANLEAFIVECADNNLEVKDLGEAGE